MKKKNLLFGSFAALAISLTVLSCGKDKPVTSESNEVVTSNKGQVYVVDTLNSKVEWKGFKVFKSDNTSHIGVIKFESGEVTLSEDKLESGKFVVSLGTLTNTDVKDAEESAKLNGHLKSVDFFDVEKFPTASYEITKVTEAPEGSDYNTILDGNLTIKGITKPISFNANVKTGDGELQIATEPKDISREEFGIKFQIPIANGLIKDEINIQMLMKAIEKK